MRRRTRVRRDDGALPDDFGVEARLGRGPAPWLSAGLVLACALAGGASEGLFRERRLRLRFLPPSVDGLAL